MGGKGATEVGGVLAECYKSDAMVAETAAFRQVPPTRQTTEFLQHSLL